MLTMADVFQRKKTVIEMYSNGCSMGEIALAVKSSSFVRNVLEEDGIIMTSKAKLVEIEAMYRKGCPITYIADDLRCSTQRVNLVVANLPKLPTVRVPYPPLPPRSRKNILTLASQGIPPGDISNMAGINIVQVMHDINFNRKEREKMEAKL